LMRALVMTSVVLRRVRNRLRIIIIIIKSPLQISGKVAGAFARTLETFQVTHILGASRGRLCDSKAFLFNNRYSIISQAQLPFDVKQITMQQRKSQ